MKTLRWAVLIVLWMASCKQKPTANTTTEKVVPEKSVNYLEESEKDFDERMAWWRDARFGMFIHWGLMPFRQEGTRERSGKYRRVDYAKCQNTDRRIRRICPEV